MMRQAVGVLVAVLIVAGCAGTASSPKPGTSAPVLTTAAASTAEGSTSAPAFNDGPIQPGTYSFLRGLGTIVVPAGWEGCCSRFGILKGDYAGILFEDVTDVIVYADACRWRVGPNPKPKGAEAVAEAFAAQRGHQGTPPVLVTVAGRPAWHVRLTVPADQAMSGGGNDRTFTGCDEGQFRSWGLAGDAGARYHQGPSQVDDLYIVDIDGRTILFDLVSGPEISATDLAELAAMLASIRIS